MIGRAVYLGFSMSGNSQASIGRVPQATPRRHRTQSNCRGCRSECASCLAAASRSYLVLGLRRVWRNRSTSDARPANVSGYTRELATPATSPFESIRDITSWALKDSVQGVFSPAAQRKLDGVVGVRYSDLGKGTPRRAAAWKCADR